MEPREARTKIQDDDRGHGYNGKFKFLDPRERQYRPTWHKIFLFCCVVAASLDPLFFYIPVIDDQKKCVEIDEKLKKTVLVLRSVMDLTYIFHIAFQIFSGYFPYTSESRELLPRVYKFIYWIMGVVRRIRWWIVIIDVLCVLPIPQVVMLVFFSKLKAPGSLNERKILNFFVLIQFVPRIFRIYLSCKELTKNLNPREITGAAWVKGLFNFFLYIIASHVVGAFWYFFSVQRELACWHGICKGNPMFNQSTFFCQDRHNFNDPIIAYLNQSCSSIDFGMFTPVLQSGIVNSKDFPRKFFYCFAWGLRNLSSFGSNLQTSTYFWESVFSAAITIIGLLLFIYLIGNLQTYLQFSAQDSEKRRREMKKKEVAIDEWIKSNDIPEDMGNELKECVRHKMDEDEDVNVKSLVNVLPNESKKRITHFMCLPILKKVTRLTEMSDKQIYKIFTNHLKPVVFKQNEVIFNEKESLLQMLFITQGSVWLSSHAPSSQAPVTLEQGDFYGEELLKWAVTAAASQAPLSQCLASKALSSQAPSSQAPASEAPSSKAPSSQPPSSKAPLSQAPSSQAASSQAPLSQTPLSQSPSSEAPSSKASSSKARSSQAPSSEEPSSQAPFPTSPKTVKAKTKVEAFALDHDVMKKIAKGLATQPGDMGKTFNYSFFGRGNHPILKMFKRGDGGRISMSIRDIEKVV